MIYDFYGNEISSIYSLTGEECDGYDIAGNLLISSIDPLPIDTVPSYFQSDVANALNYVDELGEGYVNYIAVTDSHYNLNVGNTFKIMNYLYSQGKFDKLIHLGDLLEEDNVDSDNWISATDAGLPTYKKWLFTQGNHDNGIAPISQVDSLFMDSTVHYITHSYHNAWYYDNKQYKIRFIGLHHYLYANSAIRQEVEGFLESMPNGYAWIFVSHYPMLPVTEKDDIWKRDYCMSEDAETWVKGLIDIYPRCIGIFSGHQHLDRYDLLSTGSKNFNHLTLDADIKRTGNVGTNKEQVVSILSINPTTESIKLYRIGRSEVFVSNPLEFSGFTQ